MNPQKAVLKLRAAGMSDLEIAYAANANPSTIWRIRTGKDCSYKVGTKLIEIASRKPPIRSKRK